MEGGKVERVVFAGIEESSANATLVQLSMGGSTCTS